MEMPAATMVTMRTFTLAVAGLLTVSDKSLRRWITSRNDVRTLQPNQAIRPRIAVHNKPMAMAATGAMLTRPAARVANVYEAPAIVGVTPRHAIVLGTEGQPFDRKPRHAGGRRVRHIALVQDHGGGRKVAMPTHLFSE